MKNLGITGQGFYKDRLQLGPGVYTGGGSSKITISSPTCINAVAEFLTGMSGPFFNLYSTPQDFICKNLAINSSLLPTSYWNGVGTPNQYVTHKIIVRDTI